MIIIPWVAYLIGEVNSKQPISKNTKGFNLSGVVVLLFCGISITKYALPHLTQSGKKVFNKNIFSHNS